MIIRELSKMLNKTPIPYASKSESFTSIFKKQSDQVQGMQAYGSVSTLHAIVSRLANDVSAVEWKLYKKKTDARRSYAWDDMDMRQEIASHPLLDVINNPNECMTRQYFIETIQQHIDLAGESFIVIESEMNIPYRLWPVRPDKMQPAISADEFITGYVFTTPEGQKIPFAPEEVIHLKMPNPMTPFRGMSPVTPLLIDLDSHRYASEFNRNFFLNDATPNGIIKLPGGLTDEEFQSIVIRWNEQYRGVANANKTAFVEEGVWQNTTISMRDMQFPELRRVSVETIREAFGFPKFKLGVVDDVNRATADASEVMYARSLLVPRLERIKQALNSSLLPLFRKTTEGLELDYCNPIPNDEEIESSILLNKATFVTMMTEKGFDSGELLAIVGLPQITYTKNSGGEQGGQLVQDSEQG